MARPRDDRRNANAAFKKTELRSAIRSGAASAEMRALFRGMAVIGLKNDDRPLAQAKLIDLLQQSADSLIERRDERRIQISRICQILVVLDPLGFRLGGIMGIVHREIDEEWPSFVVRHE